MRSALLALLAGLLVVVPVADAKPRGCASVEYTRESGYLVFGSTKITAQRVTCARARRVARPEPAKAKALRYKREGFTCRGTRRTSRSIAFACKRRKMRVTFTWTQK